MASPYSLIGGAPLYQLRHHSPRQWMQAVWRSLVVLAAFDRHRSAFARAQMPPNPAAHLDSPLHRATAWRDAARLRLGLHAICGSRACFAESLALCAGLRVLGWHCDTVIGFALIDMAAETAVHAWVEINGEPVLDALDIGYSYLEMQRL